MLIKTKFLKRGHKGTKYKGELRKEKGVFLCKPSAEASLLDYAEAQPKNTKCEALSKVLVLFRPSTPHRLVDSPSRGDFV